MLHTLNDLDDFVLHASDGNIGKVKDFYFDDRRWVIRYLVVEIGTWLESHKILLSPAVIKHMNREEKTLTVDMSVNEIKNSPHIDMDKTVSQQYEIDYLSYYGYAFFWGSNTAGDSFLNADMVKPTALSEQDTNKNAKVADTFAAVDRVRRKHGDRHLRSCNEIVNYHIQASDGEIGHLQSMLIDDDSWTIHYCIVNTSNWWLGHKVLITPQTIRDISWGSAKIHVEMTQQQVQNASLFDPSVPSNHQKELGVYLHYGRDGYWEDETRTKHV